VLVGPAFPAVTNPNNNQSTTPGRCLANAADKGEGKGAWRGRKGCVGVV